MPVIPHRNQRMSGLFSRVLVRIYVDSVWVHRWGCHRLPSRSFCVDNRQFHLCARCTGITAGLVFSPLLLIIRVHLPLVFAVSLAAVALDGFSQHFGWRESNNVIRVATGVFLGLTAVPSLLAIGGW